MPKRPETALCPGCEEPAPEDFLDAAERPWHERCARGKLADHFRTPLSPEDATAAVFHECAEKTFRAPHSFHLREIVFLDETAEVSGVFVGQKAMVSAWGSATIRARDLPGRAIVIDHDVPMGFTVTVQAQEGARYRLVGERRPESGRPRPSQGEALAVALLQTESIAVDDVAEARFSMPASFRGERLVADEWEDWEVVSVKVGTDSGRASPYAVALAGVSTVLPTYTARVGETVTYALRNRGDKARAFTGRVYGTISWRE